MIELGSLTNPRAAQGFIDYLKSQGLTGQIRTEDGHTLVISVAPEDFRRKIEALVSTSTARGTTREYHH